MIAQFAYNESSFMLIRLLQQVGRIHLTQEVSPEAIPPPGYFDSPPCEEEEKIFLRSHITEYVQVSSQGLIVFELAADVAFRVDCGSRWIASHWSRACWDSTRQ